MMTARSIAYFFFLLIGLDLLHAQEKLQDVGKEKVGTIKTTIYYGTNGDIKKVGNTSLSLPNAELKRLQGIKKMQFSNYRILGQDTRSVLRSYENWASPLKPSEEIMLSFESRGLSENGGLKLDLELWQHKRKVMKTDPLIFKGKPLLILGPQWRGGRLIIAVELTEISSKP